MYINNTLFDFVVVSLRPNLPFKHVIQGS